MFFLLQRLSSGTFHLFQIFFTIAMERPIVIAIYAMPMRFTALVHKVFKSFYFMAVIHHASPSSFLLVCAQPLTALRTKLNVADGGIYIANIIRCVGIKRIATFKFFAYFTTYCNWRGF
jgi:hypothetical protein